MIYFNLLVRAYAAAQQNRFQQVPTTMKNKN